MRHYLVTVAACGAFGLSVLAGLTLARSTAQAQPRDLFTNLGSVNGCDLYSGPRGCFVLQCGASASLSCR
jgi:hypothetical protein